MDLAPICNTWSVFPLAPNTKVPMKASHGFYDAKPIDQWGDWPPGANIAVATGLRSGIVVIDIDNRQSWQAVSKGRKVNTLAAETPSGGLHLFFATNQAWQSNASRIATGVDVRGEAGYVAIAPSVTRKGHYKWIEGSLEELPDWIEARLTPTAPSLGSVKDGSTVSLEVTFSFSEDQLARIRAAFSRYADFRSGIGQNQIT